MTRRDHHRLKSVCKQIGTAIEAIAHFKREASVRRRGNASPEFESYESEQPRTSQLFKLSQLFRKEKEKGIRNSDSERRKLEKKVQSQIVL